MHITVVKLQNDLFDACVHHAYTSRTMTSVELKARREALGLSQNQLARLLTVSTSTVARWEQGVFKIGTPGMLRLALEALEYKRAAGLPYKQQ
jgi:DNA-binding transcriptional regulator YiaG